MILMLAVRNAGQFWVGGLMTLATEQSPFHSNTSLKWSALATQSIAGSHIRAWESPNNTTILWLLVTPKTHWVARSASIDRGGVLRSGVIPCGHLGSCFFADSGDRVGCGDCLLHLIEVPG